jgi:hypothetical protein
MVESTETDTFINNILTELGLKGKPSFNKIKKYVDKVGFTKEKILELYYQDKEKEDYANEFMQEEGLKGKNTRIEIMKIIDSKGYSKEKIKTAYLRATINRRT